jgi:hypothetical protein
VPVEILLSHAFFNMAAATGMMIGSAIAQAATFLGGNAICGLVSKQGAEAELRRHNLAIEQLQRAQDEWAQKRQ